MSKEVKKPWQEAHDSASQLWALPFCQKALAFWIKFDDKASPLYPSSTLVPYSSPCIACQHLNLKTLSTFLFLSQATATIVFYYIGYTSVQEAPRGTILLYPNFVQQALSFQHFGIGSWGIVWFLSTNYYLLIKKLKNLLEVILMYFLF